MEALKKQRTQLKAKVTRFKNFVEKSLDDDSINIEELTARFNDFNPLLKTYDKIQSAIESLDENDVETGDRDQFEDSYYKVKARVQKVLNKQNNESLNKTVVGTECANSEQNVAKLVNLPLLDLPHFKGSYNEYTHFRDTFESLINKNSNIDDIQKFHYLISCLEGEARDLIQSLEVTSNNYNVALDLLKDRYDNKRLIINSHLQSLFDLQPVLKENPTTLRNLIDTFNKNIRALRSLNAKVDNCDDILIYLLTSKLDFGSKRDWETKNKPNESPTLEMFLKFLNSRCQMLESLYTRNNDVIVQRKGNYQPKSIDRKSFNNIAVNKQTKCFYCKQDHLIFYCKELLKLDNRNRLDEIRKCKLCINCLKPYSNNHECKGVCKICSRKHNTLLHFNTEKVTQGNVENDKVEAKTEKSETNMNPTNNNTSINTHCSHKDNSLVLLATATILIQNNEKQYIQCRALLDGGSQSNFITSNLAKRLNLETQSINFPITGIGNSLSTVTQRVNTKIKSTTSNFSENLSFLVLKSITGNIPCFSYDISGIQIPQGITLADREFYNSRSVDMLLGASIFYKLLAVGQISLGNNMPILQNTKLGWLVTGALQLNTNNNINLHCLLVTESEVQNQLEKFWAIEEVSQVNNAIQYSKDEQFCEDHFIQNYTRDESGRFTVALPLKENYKDLGDTFEIAERRFLNIEQKLLKNKTLYELYLKFMQEYENLGHMTKLNKDQINIDESIYYLPHHGVLKLSSKTTKLRVVFDASTKSSSNLSLNQVLYVGPVIQNDLFTILLRFRKHNYVIKGDITKMYRQVNIRQDQRNLQRILWRETVNEELSHYVLNTVTYGTAPASFLAIRSLKQVALDNKNNFPQAAEVILQDFYVDDMISGEETIEGLIKLKNEVYNVLKSAGFILTQWTTNIPDIDKKQSNFHISDGENTTKALGILWNPNLDSFQFSVNIKVNEQNITKRTILSVISQIFDPLGIVGPIIINAKLLLQLLWKVKLNWDERIPEKYKVKFLHYFRELRDLEAISIPRHILSARYVDLQIHGFADASQHAYGACIYARTSNFNGQIHTQLICSKSRVAPLKTVSLPRLELCACLLLSRLVEKSVQAIKLNINNIFLWTDSEIVLAWLAREPSYWKTFISNRVSEIQERTDIKQWGHVRSGDNPADIISRGCNPNELLNSRLWWHGPDWLIQSSDYWPKQLQNDTSLQNLPEKRNNAALVNMVTKDNFELFNKYSNLNKLLKVIAFCLRFINNSKKTKISERNLNTNLQVTEVEAALNCLVKLIQAKEFPKELYKLKGSKTITKDSSILNLSPFLDDQNIMRVGGRLNNADLKFDHKFPILLPGKHPFTKLIIMNEHERTFHGGVQTVLASIRTKFWPVNVKNTIKQIIHKCVVCFKYKPTSFSPIMGQLPSSRVNPSRPFSTSGIDFAGPFLVKECTLRNRKLVKIYICVFICFTTKAIHLELAGDLSTPTFLNTLRRFFARRGLAKNIWSDNGLNFVGAANKLNESYKRLNQLYEEKEVQNYFLENRVTWQFIPPRTPHFGGLWESAVKSVKTHLLKAIGTSTLTYEQFLTVTTQIECILNSRPLCPISNDPNDLEILTPGHFLIGTDLKDIPEENTQGLATNRLNKYQELQNIYQGFWKRWSLEYLHGLQQRNKWMLQDAKSLKPGLVVLLRDENIPPMQWKVGRIIEVHRGADGVARVATVRTATGNLKRGFPKLCVLPIEEGF